MARSVNDREEVGFLTALCDVYKRSILTVVQLFPPTGDPNQHRLDAIVLTTDPTGTRRVAIEITRAFQGTRTGRSSPAQNELEAWNRLEDRVRDVLAALPQVAGRVAECEIWMHEDIAPVQEAFRSPRTLKDPRGEIWTQQITDSLSGPLQAALDASLQTKRAEKAILPSEVAAVVAYAQVNAYADSGHFEPDWPPALPGVYVDVQGLTTAAPGQTVTTILPRWVGIDEAGITAAIQGKMGDIPTYKTVARSCGAEELWLVVVADGSSQMSMVASPFIPGKEASRKLRHRAAMKNRPFFDRVIFLAAGYWLPADLRLFDWRQEVQMSFAAFDLDS